MIFIKDNKWHPTGVAFLSDTESIFAVSGGKNFGIKGDGGVKLYNGDRLVWEWTTQSALYDVKGSTAGSIFVAGKNGSIYILDHQKRLKKTLLKAHSKEIDRLAIHNGRGFLASCSWDGSLKLWDSSVGKLISTFTPSTGFSNNGRTVVNEATFSPDGNFMTSVQMEGPIILWDVRRGGKVKQISSRTSLLTVDWSPDGRFIAAAGVDHNIHVYEPFSQYNANESLLVGHSESVRQLRWITRSKLISVSYDMSVKWWDINSLDPLLRSDSSFTEFVVCCDVQRKTGLQLVGCWDRTVRSFKQ